MTATTTDTTAVVIAGIDQFLNVIAAVRNEKPPPRDPLRRLEDVLLEMRCGVEAGVR